MSLNVTNAGGSGVGLSNNLELISVMREMTTDIFDKPYLNNGYIDSTNATVFKQMSAPKGILNWYTITGGGLFERTSEFENFKTDAIRTNPVISYTEEKFTKRIPVSFEAVAYGDIDMGFISLISAEMGKAARATLNALCASVYLNSFVTLGADGVPMLAATALTGNTHAFGDNVVAAATAGILTQTDIQAAVDAMLVMKDRSGLKFGGFAPVAFLTQPADFGRVNELIDAKVDLTTNNSGSRSYVSNRYGVPVYTMAELSGTVANLPVGYTSVMWVISGGHSVFNATATALRTWVQPMEQTSNAEENYMGLFHNIVGFYDGLGIVGLVF